MSRNEKDFKILSDLAKTLAKEPGDTITNNTCDEPAASSDSNSNDSSQDNPGSKGSRKEDGNDTKNEKNNNKMKKSGKDGPPVTLRDLALKKQNQNLAERKVLLIILAVLLGLQLLFMNAVVLLIVLWSIFDWKCFRVLDADVLKCILDFTKYYVTAVLVELLGGIIYIVHRVFSERN